MAGTDVAAVGAPSEGDDVTTLIHALSESIDERFAGRTSRDAITESLESAVDMARRRDLADDEIVTRLDWWLGDLEAKHREFTRKRSALANVRQSLLLRDETVTLARLTRFAGWVIEHWAAASALMALVAAAIARVAYAHYFDVFGLSPEEGGIDSTRMLIESIPGVVLLVVVVSVGAAAVQIPFMAVYTANRARMAPGVRDAQSRTDVVWFVVACVAVGLLLFFYFDLADWFFAVVPIEAYGNPVYVGAVVGGVFGAFGGIVGTNLFALASALRKWKRRVRPVVTLQAKAFLMSIIGLAPTVVILVFLLLPLAAGARAEDVLAGHSVRASKVLGVPVLGIRATKVSVEKAPVELPRDHCYMLLGIGKEETTLFDHTDSKLYRFPSGQLSVSMTGPQEACSS